MSLSLSKSNNIDCKCESGLCGTGFFEDEIRIGDYYIKKDDFAELVMYFMTNTDLEFDDVRLDLLKRMSDLKEIDGYNPGNKRLG